MWLYLKRTAECVIITLGLLAVPLITGCHGLSSGEFPDLALAPHDTKVANKEAARSEASAQSASKAISAADRAVLARSVDKDPKGRGRSVWIHAVEPTAEFRWRYPNLEEIIARPTEHQPDFPALLADNDPIVAANAAIVLGRGGNNRAKERLVEAARSPELPLPMRSAAVEALANLRDSQTAESLRELLKQYGRTGKEKKTPYIPELHAELIRGLAKHVEANSDSCFIEALRSPDANVRLEALKAWRACKQSALPVEALDLRTDGDYRLRAAALEAIASKRHPQAMEYLRAALLDNDMRVRYAAIAGLGILGGNEALAKLQKLAKDPHESIRVQAVGALSAAKAEQAVLEAAGNESWRVRQKVAEALALFPDRDAAAAADRLLEDFSAEVQHATVQALDAWPLERSGPILLTAMTKSAFVTRKAAAAHLTAKWAPAAEFPVEGPQERRAEVLKKLRQLFHDQFNVGLAASFSQAAGVQENVKKASATEVAEVERLIQQGNFKALGDYGPATVDALEQLHLDRKLLLPEPLYREVLPHYGQVFVILDHLTAKEVPDRRRAAEELLELTRKQPMGRLAIARLAQLMSTETDALIWQSVLRAIADDGSPQAIELAYTAAGHDSAEVRRRACEHLAQHPDRRHEQVLTAALEDKSQAVVCAAARALAAAGKMADTQPLSHLLGSSNEEIQLEAGLALTKLGDHGRQTGLGASGL